MPSCLRPRAVVATVVLLCLSTTATAYGQEQTWSQPTHIDAKSGFMIKPLASRLLPDGEGQVSLFSLLLRASVEIIDSLTIDGQVGLAHSTVVQTYDTLSSVRAANPSLGATYSRSTERVRLQFGGALVFPLANVRTTVTQRGPDSLALVGAAAMGGSMDLWLWVPDRLSFVGHAKASYGEPGSYVLSGEAALAAMFFTGGGSQDAEFFAQMAGEGYTFISERVAVGLRLQLSWLVTGQDGDFVDDPMQLSVQPFFHFTASPAFGRLLLTLNINDPAGFAFDTDGGYYGIMVVGGRTF